MTEEQAFVKLQDLMNAADEIVGEHYGALDIVQELADHFGVDVHDLE